MASSNIDEVLSDFLLETRETEQSIKLIQFLRCYLLIKAENEDSSVCFKSSDPHAVLSLLIQQLLTRFSSTFLENISSSDSSSLQQEGLQTFLQQEENLLLLATIQHISMQVNSTHLELVELLIVVLRTLINGRHYQEINNDHFLNILPIHSYSQSIRSTHEDSNLNRKHYRNGSRSFIQIKPQNDVPLPAVFPEALEWISEAFVKYNSLSSCISDSKLFFLLLGVIEGTTCRCLPKNNSQITGCIHTITNLTVILEELLGLWLQVRNDSPTSSLVCNGESQELSTTDVEQPRGHLCVSLLYRLILRIWLSLTYNTISSSLTPPHIMDLQDLLSRPITMVTNASMNLTKDWLFKGNQYLDSEFSFIFLESLYASVSAIDCFASNTLVPVENFLAALQVSLSLTSQEWLVYMCSKLQSIPKSTLASEMIIESTHVLLCQTTRKLIALSDHIHVCQQAAKSQLLQQQENSSRSVNYSLERSMEFDKLEQRLCKISQSLLSIFDNVPSIQLLSLQLLAQTGLDKVGIISDFLPRVSHSSVWSMPEVLDLYLELLEKAWFQLSPEYSGSMQFWSKVSHYVTPLVEGSHETALQVTYHLLFLYCHQSMHLKSALTQHVLLKYHQKITETFKKKLNERGEVGGDCSITAVDFEIEEEKVYHQHLKLLQKMATHPSSLIPFLENQKHIYSLFLYLTVSQFRLEALGIFRCVLITLCTHWEASVTHTNKIASTMTHFHLVNCLLRVAYNFREGRIIQQCEYLSINGTNFGSSDLRHVDEVHITIQKLLESSSISSLIRVSLIEHLSLVKDVWEVLAITMATCDSLLPVMNDNHIWDVIQVLAPSLANLLERVQQWKSSDKRDDKLDLPLVVEKLQETCVSLLCHLLTMATIMCRVREDPLKVLEFHCKDVHSCLTNSRLCAIPNSSSYIATLVKIACFFSADIERQLSGTETNHQKEASDVNKNVKNSPIISSKRSKIRPISLPIDVKAPSKPVKWCSPVLIRSPASGLRLLFPTLIDTGEGESDASGYEGDIEFCVEQWWNGDERYELDDEGEEEESRVAGVGSSLQNSITLARVPGEVRRRIWMEVPIWQCVDLLKECLFDEETAEKCESCLELFLSYLLALLKADKWNTALLAGKGLLGVMLDSFAPIFDSQTEKSKGCWMILCQIAEVLATYQISQSDVKKLFLKLQKTPNHLEQLALILHNVSEAVHILNQPSAYVQFSYPRPLKRLDYNHMLMIPNPRPSGLDPCTISSWLYLTKYPLPAFLHLFSIFTTSVYIQVWACACSGDVIISLSNQLQLICVENNNNSPTVSSVTVGSALNFNKFHHVFLSVRSIPSKPPQYQLLMVVDGCDVYDYQLNLPTSLAKHNESQCFVAGGVISSHLAERHIQLVNADHTHLSWKLGSLHVFDGFSSLRLASLLYQLGPECSPSNTKHQELFDTLIPSYIEVSSSDTTIINHGSISENELRSLQSPLLSYTAHHSHSAYLVTFKELDNEEGPPELHNQYLNIPSVHQLQWILSANAVNRPQLLDVLQDCTGLEQLVYLYAKTAGGGCSEEAQFSALSVISLAVRHSPYAKLEFQQMGGVRLIQQVMRTSKAALTLDIAGVFLDWSCGRDRIEVKDIEVLEHILLDWHIWHQASEEVWSKLLQQLEDLLNPDTADAEMNQIHFQHANAIVKILLMSKEWSLYNRKPLEGHMAAMFVRLIKLLLGDPPQLDCLKYVWDHLLLPDLNTVTVVRGTAPLETTVSLMEASNLGRDRCGSPLRSVSSLNTLESYSSSKLMDTYSDYPDGELGQDDSEPELLGLEFDVQSREGRLPDSSYTEEETLFTWTDITGLPFLNESDMSSKVPVNLETGLLSVMRKIICLLPDSQVKKVLGPILNQEGIVVMANNSSILVRTAVVRVLDEFFRRAGDSSQANFLQVKGFSLLALQLKQFPVSFELMSALFSIVIGQEINLQSDHQNTVFQIPRSMTGFQLHAITPVLVCVVNTITQPSLCHSTLCILKELFEMVKGMPVFMLNNGLFKMICQMIALAPETSSLSKENRQLILNDLLGFCKLIVIFTLSTDQDEIYRSLEGFLVCLKHCSDEVQKSKGSSSLAVVYLEQFIYLVLAESLLFFSSGGTIEGMAGGGSGAGGFTPSLESCQQVAGQTDLMSRFNTICSISVDWLIHGVESLTNEHAKLLTEGITIPKLISFDRKAQLVTIAAGFVRFIIHYFCRALIVVIRRNTAIGFDPTPHRFFINSRTQLNEGFSRLFGHLLSPVHADRVRAEILKEVWSLDESQTLLSSLFSSQYKKLLCTRLVVTVIDLMQSRSVSMDGRLLTTCNEVFEAACLSGATRLKHPTHLSSMLNIREEDDQRTRQRTETIMEDLRLSDQRWKDRIEVGRKDFDNRLKDHYRKLVEKVKHREQAINSASAQVTDRVKNRQNELRKSLLDMIEVAGMQEKDTLRQWRKIILTNTHPRALWSTDEGRPMCWQLDPTEGPSRVRRRLMRGPHTTDEKFLLHEAQTGRTSEEGRSPLSFIFEETAYDSAKALFLNIVRQEGEEIVGNYPQRCKNINPDSCCGGHLIVSNLCCYFKGDEPLADPNITKVVPCDEKTQLLSWRHTDVVEIHRRRYMLKDNALEIFLINGVTMLLSFETTRERDKVHLALLELEMPNLVDSGDADTPDSGKIKMVTYSWQQGEITNFEYLMELNKLAGRTFNDLMQYPVFPFILSDYKSKDLNLTQHSVYRKLNRPISIQDETKEQKYIDTYKYLETEVAAQGSMIPGLNTAKPYHYGSHYSNSGIVLHFLVRVPPFTSMFLDFQGKSFDIADRSFHDMSTTWWLSSSESATDVKELIPEFFYFPEFLCNSERFNLGVKQSGEIVDHVKLPPWAHNDPRLFVLKHRQALESEFVSRHLHEWIDLVFGYKQTGKAATQAVNVFHPATYYGADGIDIDAIEDPTQQEALKTMVKTYGQMPLQLFKDSHPPRSKSTVRTTLLIRFGFALKKLTSTSNQLKMINPYVKYYLRIIRPKVNVDCEFIGKHQPPSHKCASTLGTSCSPERITCLLNGSGDLAVTEFQAAFFPSSSVTHSSLLVTWGHWDNTMVIRSVCSEPSTLKLHHPPLNRISCCQLVCNGQMLVSAGTVGVVSFWELINTNKQPLAYSGKVHHLRGHDGSVTCLVACKPYSIVVSGSTDGTCIIWDTNRLCYVNSLMNHEGPINCLAISPTLGDIATVCLTRRESQNRSKSSQQCLLYLWTINGRLVKQIKSDVQILSLCYTSAPEGVYINVIITGMANGTIRFLSSWDLSLLCELPCPYDSAPVLSLAVSSCSTKLYAGYSNMNVVTWIKPESDLDENGEYVVVPSLVPNALPSTLERNAQSTASLLKYF